MFTNTDIGRSIIRVARTLAFRILHTQQHPLRLTVRQIQVQKHNQSMRARKGPATAAELRPDFGRRARRVTQRRPAGPHQPGPGGLPPGRHLLVRRPAFRRRHPRRQAPVRGVHPEAPARQDADTRHAPAAVSEARRSNRHYEQCK